MFNGIGYQNFTLDKKGMHYTQGITDGVNNESMTWGRHGLESVSMTNSTGMFGSGYPQRGCGIDPYMNDPLMRNLMGTIGGLGFGGGCGGGFGGGCGGGFGGGCGGFGDRLGMGMRGLRLGMLGNSLGLDSMRLGGLSQFPETLGDYVGMRSIDAALMPNIRFGHGHRGGREHRRGGLVGFARDSVYTDQSLKLITGGHGFKDIFNNLFTHKHKDKA